MRWQYPDYVEPLPVPAPGPFPRSWYPTLPDLPPRRALLPTALLVAASVFVPAPVAQALPTYVPPLLAEPGIVQRRLPETTVEPVRLGLVRTLDWYQPLSEPVRPRLRAQGDSVEPIRLGLVRTLDWYSPLATPIVQRRSPTVDEPFVFNQPVVQPSIAWLPDLSLPVQRPRIPPLDLTAAPVVPWAPPPPVAYWFPSLPDGRLRAAQATPHLLPAMAFVDTTVPVVIAGAFDDKFTVGFGEAVGVTQRPTIGGPWSW